MILPNSRKRLNPARRLLAVCLAMGMLCSALAAHEPLAWIHFSRNDRDICLYNGYPMYYVSGSGLEIDFHVDPDPEHSLAFMWLIKENPARGSKRSMKIVVNGRGNVVATHPAAGNGTGAFFWDVIPVTDFGINHAQKGKYNIVANPNPEGGFSSVVLQGVRLITDRKQLEALPLRSASRNAGFIRPGPLTKRERIGRTVDRKAARKRIRNHWVGRKKLSRREIRRDEFLSAAKRFADTVIEHGRDEYGAETSGLFVQYLHRETLKSPATMGWLNPAQGGATHPVVLSRFERSQNLLRFLASMSLFTGDATYAEAVMDATICMYEDYVYPRSGLIALGNHMSIDLVSGKAYSDGRGSEQFELQDSYPFYEFFFDVSPDKTSRFIKGIWEAYIRDWHSMRYNRHANFNTRVDIETVWDRPMRAVSDLPKYTQGGELSFISIAYDLVYSGFTLGCVEKAAKPRMWANRLLEVIAANGDPKTGIWPMMLYPPPFYRRGLEETYVEAYPDSNPTEARVIISSWINSVPIHALGVLGAIEQARKHGHHPDVEMVHRKVDEWILNYMHWAYDPEAHRMRSILLDGRDVTDHVFTEEATLHGWGAAPNGSFRLRPVTPVFHALAGQGYRLSGSPENRARYWKLLRDLYKGAGLGDLGESSATRPVFNYDATHGGEEGYVFGLADIYRVTRNAEVLKFMEHLGRTLIGRRQDPRTGLFVIEADKERVFQVLKEFKQSPEEGMTVKESLRSGGIPLDYDRPKVVTLNITEPHALLAIYGCRTGQFEKIPSWVSMGMGHHEVRKDLEVWFDRPRLEAYYEARKDYIRQKGFVIDEAWYPKE